MDAYDNGGQTGAAPAPSPAPSKPFGILGSKVRAIFAATTQHQEPPPAPAPAPVPPAPAPAPASSAAAPESAPQPAAKPSLVIIRNCSTRQILETLLAELGGASDVSGRYFAPAVQDPDRIRQVAAAHELFTKESRIRDVVVLDLMVDRTIHPVPQPGRGGPWHRRFDRDRSRERDEDRSC